MGMKVALFFIILRGAITKQDSGPVLIYSHTLSALMPHTGSLLISCFSALALVPSRLVANARCHDEVTCLLKTIISWVDQVWISIVHLDT